MACQERRSWPRHPCHLPVYYRRLLSPTRSFQTARARDISLGGICLLVSHHVAAGVCLGLRVDVPGQPAVGVYLPAMVRYSREETPGQWAVGCQFAVRPSSAQLRAMRQRDTP